MNPEQKITSKSSISNNKTLIFLISILGGITILYQFRPLLDDFQFTFISFPAFSIIPAVLSGYAIFLTIKLFKQKHSHAKAFLFFALGASFLFTAEQIWQAYDYFWEGSPFPSEADIFYLASYPLMVAFLFYSLKPILKLVSRNVWLFAIGLSFSFLIPSLTAAYDDLSQEALSDIIALAYPILSSFQLVPAIVGIMYLSKKNSNLIWMFFLFGFIIYSMGDTFYLLAELDESYYDGHPSDLMFVYSYVLFLFAIHFRSKLANTLTSNDDAMYFSERVQFQTISKFGIPLTVAIVCIVILTSLINVVIIQPDEQLSVQNFMLGIVAMLAVFGVIVITINKNLSRLVQMRTVELVEQRDNLENLVEEKTQDVLKSERLSAIGELSGRLAHDLRNPLSVMKMSIDLIKQTPKDTKISEEIITKRIELISKSIDRISHQVDDVLGYVRHSPLKLTNVSISKIIENSLEKVNVPKDIEVSISKNDIKIDCDVDKIDAVFINLIVNSIQAMHDGGTIKIDISEKDNLVILKFIDSGDGIPEDHLPKVFEPLFTTKQKGTGLGLASCKNIVEQHQGEISISNNPTTFTIALPKILSVKQAKLKAK